MAFPGLKGKKLSKFFIMKYFSFCLFFLGHILSVHCQNLVPNPSFEDYDYCPPGTGNFISSTFEPNVQNWDSWAISPDYFHVCSNDLEGFAGVPTNAWGYQWPVSGVAFSAVITYMHNLVDGREYIASQLITPLTPGTSYYVMYHIAHCDSQPLTRCATNRFGLKFFKDPSYGSGIPPDLPALPPPNEADVEYNEMLTDTANWTLVEGWFTADDSYDWIALGNFYDDANTDTTQFGLEGYCLGLYYIDNVCIGLSPEDCEYLLTDGRQHTNYQVNIFPNPSFDVVSLRANKRMISIKVVDTMGRLILQSNPFTENIRLEISDWAKGMYFIEIEWDDYQVSTSKIIKK